jgi:hypothetical protein
VAGAGEAHGGEVIEAAVTGLELAHLLQVEGEAFPWVVHGQGLLACRDPVLELLGEQRLDEVEAGGEVPVQGADGHPGHAGHGLKRRLKAVLGEDRAGRRDDRVPVALRVPAQRPRPAARHVGVH